MRHRRRGDRHRAGRRRATAGDYGGHGHRGDAVQKFAGIKFSTGILLADGFVVLSGLAVIGFGMGTGEAAANGWMLTLYSLITIYITSRVLAYLLNGASYDKLLFIISDHHEELKRFIIDDLDRSATYIKSKGMYTDSLRDMIFLGGQPQGGAARAAQDQGDRPFGILGGYGRLRYLRRGLQAVPREERDIFRITGKRKPVLELKPGGSGL